MFNMIDLFLFAVGWVIGSALVFGAYVIVVAMIEGHKSKKFDKWWNDLSTEEFLYNEEGEKIWSNKKGCIGPSTHC